MLAYNHQELRNKEYLEVAKAAVKSALLSGQEYEKVLLHYPYHLYTPNLFLRIGLGILTLIISFAALGILLLGTSSGDNFLGVLFFMGIVSIVTLEVFIRVKKIFQAGIDEVLLHSGIIYILCSIGFRDSSNPVWGQIVLSLIACVLYLFAFIRYIDRLAILLALAGFVFLLHAVTIELLHWPVIVFLLITAIAMAAVFLLAGQLLKKPTLIIYHSSFHLIQYAAVICCYGCFHIYVVENLSVGYSGSQFPVSKAATATFLYWCWTIFWPIAVLFRGLSLRLRPWIRIGLVLILSLLLFVQLHEHLLTNELAAFTIGLILIGAAYFIIKYLKTNNSVFNDRPGTDSAGLNSLLPVILIGTLQTNATNHPENQTQFGGGSFGGGGAEGGF